MKRDTLPALALVSTLAALGCAEPVQVFSSLTPAEAPQLAGDLVNANAVAPSLRAAVLWDHYGEAPAADELAAQAASAVTVLPTSFTLAIDAPPSEAILRGGLLNTAPGEPRLAFGRIVALDEAADGDPWDRVVGGDPDHLVVYAEADMKPEATSTAVLHARLARGFHLLRSVSVEDGGCHEFWDGTIACYSFRLEPAPEGFATPIEVSAGTQALFDMPQL